MTLLLISLAVTTWVAILAVVVAMCVLAARADADTDTDADDLPSGACAEPETIGDDPRAAVVTIGTAG